MKGQDYSHFIASLHQEFTYTIRDSIHKDIPLSYGFSLLCTTSMMQKLHRIKQLGPAYLIYPGAHHTRFEHSLGVFHLSRLIIIALLSKRNTIPFTITMKGIQAFLCAALLHDVGHFPYAHALKDIIRPDHETIGASFIEKDEEVRDIIEHVIGTSVESVCVILDHNRECDDKELLLYRSLLSGTLDPDKLDYLSRDATYCGVPYGVQDTSYIMRHLHIDKEGNVCVPIDATGNVEHLLFSKYLMYKYVYWHKKTRSATCMIKKSVMLALKDTIFTMNELINLSDESFASLMLNHLDHPSGKLFQNVHNGQLFDSKATVLFDKKNPAHRFVASLSHRDEVEKRIWEKLSLTYPSLPFYSVILDIPENVSFEADVHISNESGPSTLFHEVNELFTPSVVDSFTSSLRNFRLYVPHYVDSSLCNDLLLGEL